MKGPNLFIKNIAGGGYKTALEHLADGSGTVCINQTAEDNTRVVYLAKAPEVCPTMVSTCID